MFIFPMYGNSWDTLYKQMEILLFSCCSVRACPPKFLPLPKQAFRCRLMGVKPPDGHVWDASERFLDSSSAFNRKLVAAFPVRAIPISCFMCMHVLFLYSVRAT